MPRRLSTRVALAAGIAVVVAFAVAGTSVLLAAGSSDRSALDHQLEASLHRARGPGGAPAGVQLQAGEPTGPGPVVRDTQGRNARDADKEPAETAPLARIRRFGVEGGPPPPVLDPGVDRFARVTEANGEVVGSFGAGPSDFPQTPADGKLRTVKAAGSNWRTGATQLPGSDAKLQVAANLASIEDREHRLRNIVLIALLAALAGTALLTTVLTRVALSPLAALRRTAGAIGDTSDLSSRVPEEGPEETAELAHDINQMLGRLEQSSDAREQALMSARTFAADTGHELRTPLTTLQTSIDTLRRGDGEPGAAALDAAERELARLSRVVGQLQILARGEAGPPSSPEKIEPAEMAEAALSRLRQRWPEAKTELRSPDPGPVINGDGDGVEAILDNLLENAVRHGGPTTRVEVEVKQVNGNTEVIVDDDGPGIPVADRERVVQRFARGESPGGEGSGLGLAIVAAQAARHGGSLELGDSALGGLRARVTLCDNQG